MTRTERTYYLVFGLYSLWAWFVAPYYPLFLRSRGLDALEVNLVLATYLIVVFAFEVPTGVAADLLGRKWSFLLSCAVRALAFGLYAVSETFVWFAVAETIDGIGTTLATGALDAWAVDGMRAEGDERPVDRFFARAQVVARVVMVAGGVTCAYLAEVNYALPWWVACGGFAVTGVVAAALMKETRRAVAASPARPTFLRAMREGFAVVRGAPVLWLVCALTAATFFALIPAHMLWQARMTELSGEGVWIMGWFWVLMNVAGVIGSVVLPRLLARWRRSRVLFVAAVWRALFLAVAAVSTTLSPALAGWLLQEVSFGVSEPVLQAWTNEHVAAERRATVISIRSMFGTLGGGVGLVVLGFIARDRGIPTTWLASAFLVLLAAPAYLLLENGRQTEAVPQPSGTEPPVPAKLAPPAVS